MRALQNVKVPAGVVQNQEDMFKRDPHIIERGFYVYTNHKTLGPIAVDGIPCKLSETPGYIREPPPLLGEHTQFVLEAYLGMNDEQIADLTIAGIIE